MKQSEVTAIRNQIEELQGKLAEVERADRTEKLEQMREWQRQYRFNGRELGPTFRVVVRKKGSASE